ncbi:hypothetical protein CEB3_c28310 [Peptococcaceae bacterium CEB3]|nr:hypothetical protein CEB3_c28310 [Peptococcaceae bacterium CEB3]
MTRSEILLWERDRIIANLKNPEGRVKWLTALMDVDDELEELQVHFPKKAPDEVNAKKKSYDRQNLKLRKKYRWQFGAEHYAGALCAGGN